MKKLFILLPLILVCFYGFSSGFNWGHKTCDAYGKNCGEVKVKFKSEDDCLSYDEKSGHRCKGKHHLRRLQEGAPVCWKHTSSIASGKCVKI